jgi:hypothetical protein
VLPEREQQVEINQQLADEWGVVTRKLFCFIDA